MGTTPRCCTLVAIPGFEPETFGPTAGAPPSAVLRPSPVDARESGCRTTAVELDGVAAHMLVGGVVGGPGHGGRGCGWVMMPSPGALPHMVAGDSDPHHTSMVLMILPERCVVRAPPCCRTGQLEDSPVSPCGGNRTRTGDLWVMGPPRYLLRYPALRARRRTLTLSPSIRGVASRVGSHPTAIGTWTAEESNLRLHQCRPWVRWGS